MIINITQHCTLRCPHCMQNAGPERNEYMDKDTFRLALDFANKIGSRTILISGGEPTSHPEILSFIDMALSPALSNIVTIVTNGTFIRDHALTEALAERSKKYNPRLIFQVSSFKGLYSNYDELHKPGLRARREIGYKSFILCDKDTDIRIKPLGRAAAGEWYERAKRVRSFPTCANYALAAAQMPEMSKRPGAVLELIHRFCAPMVSYDGSVRMGESEQCRIIANIKHDTHEDVLKAISTFRPCGGCDSYKWHFDNPQTEQEKQIVKVLNI